jgi:hypothetical protein
MNRTTNIIDIGMLTSSLGSTDGSSLGSIEGCLIEKEKCEKSV